MSQTDGPPLKPEWAPHIVPLCTAPKCAKLRGHSGEHGPVTIIMTPLIAFQIEGRP